MFKQSTPQTSPSLFSGFQSQLSGKKLAGLTDLTAWHNVFKEQITIRIDERPFCVLYDSTTGRTNASIRQLVSMSILKEGHGWSDQQLFEQCRYNILVMNALGMNNIDDEVPVESTWYLFRQRLHGYQMKEGQDLIGACFEQLTRDQAEFYGVSGKKLRMDSKLIGSNIAKSTRLQLVINCLQEFYKHLEDKDKDRLECADRSELEELSKQKSGLTIYRLTPDEQHLYLDNLGRLLVRLIDEFDNNDNDKTQLLERILREQYHIEDQTIKIKKNKEIGSNSLQSVHDQDASFRLKGTQKVQGYAINISETCNDEGLNLVTDVKVEKATYSDVHFLKQAIDQSKKIVGKVQEAYMDGGYNSLENANEINDTTLYFTGIQGAWSKFEFRWNPKGELIVTDNTTGTEYVAKEIKSKRFRITLQSNGKKTHRYFTRKAVDSYFRRKRIAELPEEILHVRPNVEATIFQLCYLSRNNKTRYRGRFKHQLWAHCRGLWMNARRIHHYLLKDNCPNGTETPVIALSNRRLSFFCPLVIQYSWLRTILTEIWGSKKANSLKALTV